jgi:hypothetical protein
MPSVERYISTPLSYKPLNPREFNDVKVDVVLEKTAMLSLQGILVTMSLCQQEILEKIGTICQDN